MPTTQLSLRKIAPEPLRSLGLDETWLQLQITNDPSLIGLGELSLIQREKRQPSGGRIDLILSDSENETRYEVELMLGPVNESHIIRTIEYWDIERQRYPTLEHRAVIIAEQITSRFFNVIRLLNRAVPIIAIQLSAFRFNDEVVLQFIRVLDTYEYAVEVPEEPGEIVDSSYWEKRSNPESLAVMALIQGLTPNDNGDPRLTYNSNHIALGTSGYNFCWFHPRKKASHCHMHIKVGAGKRQEILDRLDEAGIEAGNHGPHSIRLSLDSKDIEAHRELIAEIIRNAEEWSHR